MLPLAGPERCRLSNHISLSSGSDVAESKNILSAAAPELATSARCVILSTPTLPFHKEPGSNPPAHGPRPTHPTPKDECRGGMQTK